MFNLSNLEKNDIFIDIPESDFNAIAFHVIHRCRSSRKEDIFKGIVAREQLKSTAIGNNTAIPHCRIDGLDCFYVKFVLFKERLGYRAPDGEEIRYVFFVAGPSDDQCYYLNILAHIAKVMKNDSLRKELRQAANSKAVCQLFHKYAQEALEEVHIWK